MKQITAIHARLANPTCLSILWLLNKYGEMPVRDVVHVFGKSPQHMNSLLGQMGDAGLISRTKEGGSDGRSATISLVKEFAPYYTYTLLMIGDNPEMKSVESKYKEWLGSYKR